MKSVTVYIIFIISSFSFSLSQDTEEDYDLSNLCKTQKTCDLCITSSPLCAWCSNENIAKCNTFDRLLDDGCEGDEVKKYEEPKIMAVEDEDFSDFASEQKERIVQIKPQKVSIKLSPFSTSSIMFNYRPAKDYPLDLYYLMDLSWSMLDDKETLTGLRNDLPIFLQNLTKNFRLGFGSFADKPVMPYIMIEEKNREKPCREHVEYCEPTYDFRHRLSLTNNVNNFIDVVNASGITANLDNAEGGLDALMQVMVCENAIGWKPMSRKIVIFATDGILHFAGDGILGGASMINDKKCHLDEDGNYKEDTNMDYPSLEQIFRVLIEKKISIIFAVTKENKEYYENIENIFPEYVFVATLSDDSSNILNLVKQGYESFVNVIKFEDNADKDLKISYFSNCGVKNRPMVETSKCDDVVMGDNYVFTLNISMNKCPSSKKDHIKNFTVAEVQLGQDDLFVDVKMLCSCDCDDSNTLVQCQENAKVECGKCICLEGWYGKNCDCNEDKEGSLSVTTSCKKPGDVLPCSGVGDCFCDTCHCDEGFEGQYCECKQCPKSATNGEVCGGKFQGTCVCGDCKCQEKWTGHSCSCSLRECIAPWDTRECSGRGICNCETCDCREENGQRYTGKYCETCADCENPACSVYEECIKCVVSGNCTQYSCLSKDGTTYKTAMVSKRTDITDDQHHCILRTDSDDQSCQYKYIYNIQKDMTVKLEVFPKQCSSYMLAGIFPNVPSLIGSVVVMTILVGGIFIIVFKVYSSIADMKEYKRFEAEKMKNEIKMDRLDENPLYKSPITNFVVPDMYRGSDDNIFSEPSEQD